MSKIPQDLSHIKALLFDVDGVLSRQTISLDEEGNPIRTANVRDGYAIRQASNNGLIVGIISGGYSESIPKRYRAFGMQHIYMQSANKMVSLDDFIEKTGIRAEEILFCGDDVPDILVMERVGFAVAPRDASPDVKAVADYISPIAGGEGVARDLIEQILRMKGLWMHNTEAFGW